MWQRFDTFERFDGTTLHTWHRRIQGRPGWVWKATLFTALIVVAVPILILVATAVIAAAIVFTALSLVARGIAFVGGLFSRERWMTPRDDGRRNVRIRVRGPEEPRT